MAKMETTDAMDQSDPSSESTTGVYFHFRHRNRPLTTWQRVKLSLKKIWNNTHIAAKLGVSIVLLGFLVYAVVPFGQPQMYGLACSTSQDCKSEYNLECSSNSSCECVQPKTGSAIFDSSYITNGWISTTTGACVIQPGGACRPPQNYPCASNSVCSTEGHCECIKGFYLHRESQICRPLRSHNQSCNSTLACHQGLICHEQKCNCDTSKTIFEGQSSRCLRKVGQECSLEEHQCVQAALCSGGKCVCAKGLQASSDSQSCVPLLKLGEKTCSESLKCGLDSFSELQLKCMDQTCSCDPDTSVLEHEHCMPKAGQLCVEGECYSDSVCDMPARLKSQTSKTKYRCKCRDDKEPHAKTGLCVSKYQAPCRTNSDCGHSMACKGFKCHCQFSYQLFDASKNQCASKVSGKCGTNEDCGGRSWCYKKLCYCLPLSAVTSEGRCAGSHGQNCKIDEDCSHEALLKCIDGVSISSALTIQNNFVKHDLRLDLLVTEMCLPKYDHVSRRRWKLRWSP